jgi:serine/threonine protein kinase/class 3 adenylate cyclase
MPQPVPESEPKNEVVTGETDHVKQAYLRARAQGFSGGLAEFLVQHPEVTTPEDRVREGIGRLVETSPNADETGGSAVAPSPRASDPVGVATGVPSLADVGTRRLLALLFTDIVGSTALKSHLGMQTYRALLTRHNEIFESSLRKYAEAKVVNRTGDGYFASFATASDAVAFALAFQSRMGLEPWEPQPLAARLGIHLGEVSIMSVDGREDLSGLSADIAARVMSVAVGGQILLTRPAFEDAMQFLSRSASTPGNKSPELAWADHGKYLLKGAERAIELFEIGVKGFSPLVAPPNGEKAVRVAEAPLIARTGGTDGKPEAVPGYELIRPLGRGSFGEVWLARNTAADYLRAIKILHHKDSMELEGIKNLKRRVGEHPNLFPVDDVVASQDRIYVLMPLADASASSDVVQELATYEPLTLEVHLRRTGRLPAADVLGIGAQLASALAHLHGSDVTHGDVKPANVLRKGGTWRLADYGLLRGPTSSATEACTPAFSPPEGPGGPLADQYALGVVMFCLLTGEPPDALQRLEEVLADLPADGGGKELASIIQRATAANPRQRWHSCADLGQQLERISSKVVPTGLQREPRSISFRQVPAGALGCSVVVVLAAALMVVPLVTFDKLYKGQGTASGPVGSNQLPMPSTHASLEVTSFDVQTLRKSGEEPPQLLPLGNAVSHAYTARLKSGDDVRISATFSRPAYAYVFVLDPTGGVNLIYPKDVKQIPPVTAEVSAPLMQQLWILDPGANGIVLIASAEPLPAFTEWIAANHLPWQATTATGRWLYDGKSVSSLGNSERGGVEDLSGAPKAFTDVAAYLASMPGSLTTRAVLLPVNPAGPSKATTKETDK